MSEGTPQRQVIGNLETSAGHQRCGQPTARQQSAAERVPPALRTDIAVAQIGELFDLGGTEVVARDSFGSLAIAALDV